MKYDIQRTSQFKKDYKLAKKRGLNIDELKTVVSILDTFSAPNRNTQRLVF